MPKETVSKVTRVTRKTGGAVAAKTSTTSSTTSSTTLAASATKSSATSEMVALRAYEIYLEEGRPEGRELEHWIRAEAELLKN